jgi:hypothetical protein
MPGGVKAYFPWFYPRLKGSIMPTEKSRPGQSAPPKPYEAGEEQERLLDEAIEETFPASDPISPATAREPLKTK